MSELPAGWEWTTLQQIADWGSGGTPKAKTASYYDGPIPWAVIGDLTDGPVSTTQGSITELGLRSSSAKVVGTDVVLIAMYGSIGKLGLPTIDMATNQAIAFARPREGILQRYLFYFLMHARPSLAMAGKGATQSNISQTILKAWPVPVPPTSEQKRIVATIEEQFSRLDAGSAALERVQQNLRRLRAKVLDAAVTGNLVPRDPDYNAAARLVALLHDEATAMAKQRNPILQELSRYALPDGWEMVTLADLAASIDYGTSEKTRNDVDGVPILRMGNLGWGTISYDDLKYLEIPKLDAKLLLKEGDLLFNRTNSAELVGKTAVFRRYSSPISFASYLIRVSPLSSANMEWASLVLNSTLGRRYVASVRNQQVGQANVNGSKLGATPIPLPSWDEQARVLAEVERMFSVIDSLEAAKTKARYRVDQLRGSVLATGFSGKLVTQDPSDEPASLLLERIAAEHASSPKSARARKPRTPSRQKAKP